MPKLTGFHAAALVAAVGFVVAPVVIFLYTPIVPSMGLSQKIFYYHVSCAWLMLVSALIAGGGAGMFLFGSDRPATRARGDRLCLTASELTVLFGCVVLTTGPLWAKKAWGHYWVWDARLTTMLILFLTFVAAMLARRYAGAAARQVAAGAALLGAVNVPIVYAAVKIWETTHPPANVAQTLSPALRPALWISVATFTLFYVLLLLTRLRQARLEQQLDDLMIAAAERSDDFRRAQ